jgi:hypothetical protein
MAIAAPPGNEAAIVRISARASGLHSAEAAAGTVAMREQVPER